MRWQNNYLGWKQGAASALWEVNQEFMVSWGNLQRSESQRHPCHDCSRAILSCPSAGLHFILCPLESVTPSCLWDALV